MLFSRIVGLYLTGVWYDAHQLIIDQVVVFLRVKNAEFF